MLVMTVFLAAAVLTCFFTAVLRQDCGFSPHTVPEKGVISQILRVAVISPWAFIGFESISHASEEFSFKIRIAYKILAAAVISATLLYVAAIFLSASAYPPRYASWLEYIRESGSLEGIEGLPAFYAAWRYLGGFGINILAAALLALVLTSLIGNTLALSRLFYALAKDGILPERISKLNRHGIPGGAIMLIAGVSLVLPFIGRTAIGWIMDVTTLGATMVYAFVSACAAKTAQIQNDRLEKWTGGAGLAVMTAFMLYILLPNLFTAGSIETVSYFLFALWSVLGFIYFHAILKRDRERRFGRSLIVWLALLSLMLFVSLVWMSQSMVGAAEKGISAVEAYYGGLGVSSNADLSAQHLGIIRHTNARSVVVVCGLIGLSLSILLNNYRLMSRRALHSELQLGIMTGMVNTDSLTGVKSKRAFTETERLFDLEIREGKAEPFSVVVCDVNGLKHINDTLGHKAGDAYIKAASEMICELFQHSPVYRLGGDEFVILLQGRDYRKRHEIMEELHIRSAGNIAEGKAVVSGGMSDYERGKDANIRAVF